MINEIYKKDVGFFTAPPYDLLEGTAAYVVKELRVEMVCIKEQEAN